MTDTGERQPDSPLDFEDEVEPEAKPSFLLGVLRMLRLPNVFTAWADVALGYWMLQAVVAFGDRLELALLIASSSCLYLSGMVWNDVFDVEIDRRERPNRPIPSGVVSLAFARGLAIFLTIAGIAFAAAVGIGALIAAVALVIAILLYDAVVKGTPAGPIMMGLCRSLNVLLGSSPVLYGLATGELDKPGFLPDGLAAAFATLWWSVPLGNGIYTTGFTLLAKNEAGKSQRSTLLLAAAIIFAGFAMHFWSLTRIPRVEQSALLLGAFVACVVGYRVIRTLIDPSPRTVQQAVVSAITALITLDAMFLLAIQSRYHALLVICLLPATILLGRWLYRT